MPGTGARSRVQVQMAIEGLDCVLCAAGLQNELSALPGVVKAEVSYQTKMAAIEYDPELTGPVHFAETVKKSGFTVGH